MCEPPFATAGIYYPFFPSVSHASNYTSNYKIATPIRGGKAPNQAPGLRETWFCRSRRIIGEALSPKPILLSLSISLALSLFLCLSRSVFLTLSLPPSLSLSPSRGYIGYPCEATRRHPLHSIPPRPPPPPHVTSLILLPAEYPSEALRRPEVTFSDNLSLSLSLFLSGAPHSFFQSLPCVSVRGSGTFFPRSSGSRYTTLPPLMKASASSCDHFLPWLSTSSGQGLPAESTHQFSSVFTSSRTCEGKRERERDREERETREGGRQRKREGKSQERTERGRKRGIARQREENARGGERI